MFVGQSQQQQQPMHQQQFMNVTSNQKYPKDNKPMQAKANFSNSPQGSHANVSSSPQTSVNQAGGPSSKPKQNSRTSLQNQPRGAPNQSQQQISMPQQQQQQQQQQQLSNSASSQQLQQAQLQQQTQHQRSLENNSLNNFDDADKRSTRYPDSQQVFVGNLSPDLSENELKQFFGQFGKVVEVRINTNTKQQSGRRLPNYGFVVFDDKLSVDNLLGSSKSNNLTYKNDKGEYRLNVEEKRARQARMSNFVSGGNGAKPDRTTRSSSNGSRNRQQNGTSKKQTMANHPNENYMGGPGGAFDKRKEIHENSLIDNNSQRKNTSRRS
jgi:hypothetical protein